MTQNVVTYTVEIITDNSDGKLLPYMTANIQFQVDQRKDALLVPNAALRWIPPEALVAPESREVLAKTARRNGPADGKKPEGEKENRDQGVLWVEAGDFVRLIPVHVGLSDGTMTEISGDNLSEDMEVVMGEVRQNGTGGTTNPFTPQLFGGKKPQ
jgi:HlyD family secretion protein